MRLMRFFSLGVLTLISACAEPQVATVGPYQGSRAYFANYPGDLLDTAEATCGKPADTVLRPRAGWVQCRRFLGPEPTAFAILKYDGTIENLPVLVINFRSDRSGSGYVVTNENYLSVPRSDGSTVHVIHPDPQVTRQMRALLHAAGGTVLAADIE